MSSRNTFLAALAAACLLPSGAGAAEHDGYGLRFVPRGARAAGYDAPAQSIYPSAYEAPMPPTPDDIRMRQIDTSLADEGDDNATVASDWADACCTDSCCGDCCGSHHGCCGCDACCRKPRILFGLIAPTDTAFNNFVSPTSNPLFFEDPRTLTEVRPIFVEHAFPRGNPVLQGGDAQLYAVQFRAAITERLSLIAKRDLWLDIHSPGIGDRAGWMDLGLGFKYCFLRRPDLQTLASAGITYDIPLGSDEVFQGNGDGDWHFFLSGGTQVADDLFWMSGAGFRIPNNHHVGSQMFYWSNSFQYHLLHGRRSGTGLWALWEINWYHFMRSGTAYPFNFEGVDVINFGSADVAGQNLVTMSWGPTWKPTPMQEIAAGFEIPVTQREEIYRNRVYVEWAIRY